MENWATEERATGKLDNKYFQKFLEDRQQWRRDDVWWQGSQSVGCADVAGQRLWNVNAATMGEGHRRNNVVEGQNSHLRNLIGHYHSSIWSLLEALQANTAEASTAILKYVVDNLVAPTRSSAAKQYQQRLLHLCEQYPAGCRSLPDFLRSLEHSIHFGCEQTNRCDA